MNRCSRQICCFKNGFVFWESNGFLAISRTKSLKWNFPLLFFFRPAVATAFPTFHISAWSISINCEVWWPIKGVKISFWIRNFWNKFRKTWPFSECANQSKIRAKQCEIDEWKIFSATTTEPEFKILSIKIYRFLCQWLFILMGFLIIIRPYTNLKIPKNPSLILLQKYWCLIFNEILLDFVFSLFSHSTSS